MVLKKSKIKIPSTSDRIFELLDSLTYGAVRGRRLVTASYSIKNNFFTRRKLTMKKLKTILMGLRTNLGATQVFVDDK